MSTFRWISLVLLLASSGCEMGSQWFSMSSDSPMPWFGFDLMPRRRTTQILPHARNEATRQVASRRNGSGESSQTAAGGVWSKELHLPSIPPLFESFRDEELTFQTSASTDLR